MADKPERESLQELLKQQGEQREAVSRQEREVRHKSEQEQRQKRQQLHEAFKAWAEEAIHGIKLGTRHNNTVLVSDDTTFWYIDVTTKEGEYIGGNPYGSDVALLRVRARTDGLYDLHNRTGPGGFLAGASDLDRAVTSGSHPALTIDQVKDRVKLILVNMTDERLQAAREDQRNKYLGPYD